MGWIQRVTAMIAVAFIALAAAFSSAGVTDAARKLVMEEFTIDAADPGIKLYVRNKRPEDMNHFTSDKTLLFVHGLRCPPRQHLIFRSKGYLGWTTSPNTAGMCT